MTMELFVPREDLFSLGVALLAGSLVGLEREYKNKSAGFRTIVLICVGAAAFTMVSRYGVGSDDRIAANIITGIGFIGAGVIFKDKFSVMGLTTAAVIWVVAAVGMAAGTGNHGLALLLAVLTVFVLAVFSQVEKALAEVLLTRTLYVSFRNIDRENLDRLAAMMDQYGIKYARKTISKRSGQLSAVFELTSDRKTLRSFNDELIQVDYISEFYYYS